MRVSVDEIDHEAIVDGVPSLVRVISSDRPLQPPIRMPLDDIARVTLARGELAFGSCAAIAGSCSRMPARRTA